jgi:ubiquinone/menaquinone biosynthesis C-methylase UbiE
VAAAANIPGALLIGQLWWYSVSVLRPAQVLKAAGILPLNELGTRPADRELKGLGQQYSRKRKEPVFLEGAPNNYDTVEKFDEISRVYGTYVEPFSRPVFDEVIKDIARYVPENARILDCSCGPGTETLRLASRFPKGEVVAMDLSAEMVAVAARNARDRSIRNIAFFQADVTSMPSHFTGRFDAVYCSFAFHHYSQPLNAVREMHRALRARGKAFIIDPGPAWMKALASPMAKWADPGWVGFHTGAEFQDLFHRAGFSAFYWSEILPGIGLSIATK